MKIGILTGSAPVTVGELYNAIATAPAGVKPRPVASGSAEMVGLPVLVAVWPTDGSGRVELAVESWILGPHVAKWTDPETGAVKPEVRGELLFIVSVPAGYELRKIPEPRDGPRFPLSDAETEALISTMEQDTIPGLNVFGIPELDGIDPAVFAANPERHSEMMRELNTRNSPRRSGTTEIVHHAQN